MKIQLQAIYRRNARRWDKFKRRFRPKRSHHLPIQDPLVTVNHSPVKETQIESDSGNDGNRIYQARETGFKLDDFDLIRVIGRGSYAKVTILFTVGSG